MADFAHDMDAHRRIKAIEERLEGGGGPPHNGDMERLAKLEAIIPTLATKEDVMKLRGETKEGLESVRGTVALGVEAVRGDMKISAEATRAEIHKASSEIFKWIVVTALGLGAAAITVGTFVLNNAIPKAPPAPQAPIVITTPAQTTYPPAKP